MAKYQYDGDYELYFPGLGLTVNNGDQFDAPDDLSAYGVSLVSKSKSAPADPVTPDVAPADVAPETVADPSVA
jgi:hypothetical protein